LFDELVDLPPSQRRARLESEDVRTRDDLTSLLAAYDDAGEFLAERGTDPGDLDPCGVGNRLGAYELVELIGEGGFARVFRAFQREPVRRDVAIKLIKLGMDTRTVIARFELERQTLAVMNHPGIAAVYDAGVSDTGRPYFVMELVHGSRITRFADEAELDFPSRIRLFIEVCLAVHHAHTKGVLHRDLKPSNILVTRVDGRPVPKVIDFGIAKATQLNQADATLLTMERQLLGTPKYMSPEQARSGGSDVDTRSDIYSLGAVLHELLSGVPPLVEARKSGSSSSAIAFIQRLTDDQEWPRASACAPPDHRRLLKGELDWIIGRCLEKERARRYESAAALAADLSAYLDHRPIVAAPPSQFYRAQKFLRRNFALSVAIALAVATLLAGSIVSTTMAIRARRAEHVSQQRFDELRGVALTFTFDIDQKLAPIAGTLPARIALLEAASRFLDQLSRNTGKDQELISQLAQAYFQLGQTLQSIGDKTKAVDAFSKSLPIFRALYEADPSNTQPLLHLGQSIAAKSAAAMDLGRPAEQIDLCRWGIAQLEAALRRPGFPPAEVADLRNQLAVLYCNLADSLRISGEYSQALDALHQSLGHSDALPEDHRASSPSVLRRSITLQKLGEIHEILGDLNKAYESHAAALQLLLAGSDEKSAPPSAAMARNYARLGHVAWRMGRLDLAVANHSKQYDIRKSLAEAEPASTVLKRDLARAMRQLGLATSQTDLEKSMALLDQSIDTLQRVIAQKPDDLTLIQELAESYLARGRVRPAEQSDLRLADFQRSIEANQQVLAKSPVDASAKSQLNEARLAIEKINGAASTSKPSNSQ
jgi:serine/threonine protein kinase